jgi:hypothetical protein
MRNVLLLLVLLCTMVVTAHATMVITIRLSDSDIWADYPDSKFTIVPSQTIEVGILQLPGTAPVGVGSLALGLADGLGSLDATSAITKTGVTAALKDDALAAASFGIQNPFVGLDVTTPINSGLLVRKVMFHCDGEGDVTLYLDDNNGEVLDSQVIHQIPEPMTIALLGIGGLAMRMFRKR